MSDVMALRVAIDLLLVPSQARFLRAEPLPEGVERLLRIAAGDDEVERAAAALMDRSRDLIRHAATFFIEQILFAPHADSYRVLGTSPQASTTELRRNVGLLLRWLHPDLDPQGERSIFVSRVTAAWNDLKTAERRAAYDEKQRKHSDRGGSRAKARKAAVAGHPRKKRFASGDGEAVGSIYRQDKRGFLRRALSILFHPQRH